MSSPFSHIISFLKCVSCKDEEETEPFFGKEIVWPKNHSPVMSYLGKLK